MLAILPELPSTLSDLAGGQDHIPAFPPEFDGDNGEFLKHYDKIQEKLDNEM